MKKRRAIAMIAIFIVIIIGIGSFVMIKGTKKTPVSDEQKHEPIQASEARSFDNQKNINVMNKREIQNREISTPNNPPNIITPTFSSDGEESNAASTSVYISGINDQPTEEDKKKLMEKQDKRCMELMHEHGWYKPEDIPITYAEPQGPVPSVGVYLWKKVKGVPNPKKKTPEYEAKNRELSAVCVEAFERGDIREFTRIGQELDELIRPYQPLSVRVKMHLAGIPSAWSGYFVNLANVEQQKIFEEENRQQ